MCFINACKIYFRWAWGTHEKFFGLHNISVCLKYSLWNVLRQELCPGANLVSIYTSFGQIIDSAQDCGNSSAIQRLNYCSLALSHLNLIGSDGHISWHNTLKVAHVGFVMIPFYAQFGAAKLHPWRFFLFIYLSTINMRVTSWGSHAYIDYKLIHNISMRMSANIHSLTKTVFYHTCQGYPGYFQEPHWKSMGLPEISRVTWQLCFILITTQVSSPQARHG